jgi:hypothetical protein
MQLVPLHLGAFLWFVRKTAPAESEFKEEMMLVAGQVREAIRFMGHELAAVLGKPQVGVGTFHVIQSRTRVMGWHFSPRYSVQNSGYRLALFATLLLCVKTRSVDDSRYGPCNQPDTPRE